MDNKNDSLFEKTFVETESSNGSLLIERPLISVEKFAERENISISTVENYARLGILQIRRHKGRRYVVDIPPSPNCDAEISDGTIDFQRDLKRITEIVKRILPEKTTQNNNLKQSQKTDIPEIKPGNIAEMVQRMIEKSAKIGGKPIDQVFSKKEPIVNIEEPKLVGGNISKNVDNSNSIEKPLKNLKQTAKADKIELFDQDLTNKSKQLFDKPIKTIENKNEQMFHSKPFVQASEPKLTTAEDILKLIKIPTVLMTNNSSSEAKPNQTQIPANHSFDSVLKTEINNQQKEQPLDVEDEIRLIEDVYEPFEQEKPIKHKIHHSIPNNTEETVIPDEIQIEPEQDRKILITVEKTRKIVAIIILIMFIFLITAGFWLYSDRTAKINKLNQANTSIDEYLKESEKIKEKASLLENKFDTKVNEAEQLRKELENSKTDLGNVYNELSKTKEDFDTIRQRNTQAVERLNQRIQQLSNRLTELQELQAAPKTELKK